MKNLLPAFKSKAILFLLFAELLNFSAQANPGDTTWVTIFHSLNPTSHGNYDTVTVFPTGLRYRKIRLHYILGRSTCPPPPPGQPYYCGSWDYTTQLYARPTGMDTVEMARIITPYAGSWSLTKTHEYIVDVTDYASALQGNTAMRFYFDGWSYGFTFTLKLEMIEGIPPMDALSVKNIYDGYYTYGAVPPAPSIESYLVPKALTYTASSSVPYIKNTVTGHGNDTGLVQAQCSEFCSRYYQLNINSAMISQVQLWKPDCGANPESFQQGTWVYARANWCPGEAVTPIYHDISGYVSANTTFTVDADMQPYVSPTRDPQKWGGYNWVSQLIDYSAPNQTTDLSIEDVLAPSTAADYSRYNPTCSNPVIRIKNTGSQPITNAVFNYGIVGGASDTYTWTGGGINFLDQLDVTLVPGSAMLTNTASSTFTVAVVSVNGITDDNAFNNTYQTTAPATVIYPSSFVVKMLTNNFNQTDETSWTLYDAQDNVIASETFLSSNTLYVDTIQNLPDGCYRFSVTDLTCDGLDGSYYGTNSGSLYLMRANVAATLVSFGNDFGCGFDKYFKVMTVQTNTTTTDVGIPSYIRDNDVAIYPNPASQIAYLKLDLNKSQNVSYRIADVTGHLVQQRSLNKVVAAYENVDISSFANGVYIVTVQLEEGSVTRKLVVSH